MKLNISLIITLTILSLTMFGNVSSAKLENWTNKEGKTILLDLIEVKTVESKLVGIFYTSKNKKAAVREETLSAESVAKLKAWVSKEIIEGKPAMVSSDSSASKDKFSPLFSEDLVELDDKKLVAASDFQTPVNFYVFYYAASTCPKCKEFTPTLVKFYNKEKTDNFEVILISLDNSENAMTSYAVSNKMPWPQLMHSKVKQFMQSNPQGVSRFPALVVTDLEGKIVKSDVAESIFPDLKKLIAAE